MFSSDRSKLSCMDSQPDVHEQQIIRSWHTNAKPWTKAIQSGSLASRKLVTDRAIIDAVSSVRPSRGFDVVECREPTALDAITPASIIFVCKARRTEQTRLMEPHL